MSRRVFVHALTVALLLPVFVASHHAVGQDATPAGVSSPVLADGGVVFSVDGPGGRTLRVACEGSEGPTVLQEIGGPDPTGGVTYIQDGGADIAALLGTRFCGYDRAGTGGSEADPAEVRSLSDAGADLLAVLAAPELDCPCIVMAESLGGGIALAALAQDSSNFAGLISLDALTPGFSDTVLELAPEGSPEAAMTGFFAGENEEAISYHMTPEMAPTGPVSSPVVVMTHGAGDPPPCPCSPEFPVDELEAAWQAGQAELATGLGVELVVAENTGHLIAGENPEIVLAALFDMIEAYQAPGGATPTA
jgi:pimeloyl-ACP methyl ester carboxylesterase